MPKWLVMLLEEVQLDAADVLCMEAMVAALPDLFRPIVNKLFVNANNMSIQWYVLRRWNIPFLNEWL